MLLGIPDLHPAYRVLSARPRRTNWHPQQPPKVFLFVEELGLADDHVRHVFAFMGQSFCDEAQLPNLLRNTVLRGAGVYFTAV